jgi:hypothetical protein
MGQEAAPRRKRWAGDELSIGAPPAALRPALDRPWNPDDAPRPRPGRSCGRIPSRAPAEGDRAAGKCAAGSSSAIRVAGKRAAGSSSAIRVAGKRAARSSSAIRVPGKCAAGPSSAIQVAGKRAAGPSSAIQVAGKRAAGSSSANRVPGSGVAEGSDANRVTGRPRAPRSAGTSAASPGSRPGRAGPWRSGTRVRHPVRRRRSGAMTRAWASSSVVEARRSTRGTLGPRFGDGRARGACACGASVRTAARSRLVHAFGPRDQLALDRVDARFELAAPCPGLELGA